MRPVDVSITVNERPVSQAMVTGSIRISVDGEVLTRHVDENGDAVQYDNYPVDYVGTRVLFDLLNLTKEIRALKRGEISLYEQRRVQFDGEQFDVIFERLSDDAVRVAFQARTTTSGSFEYSVPPADAALGAAVDVDELCDEIVRCDEELLNFARNEGLDTEEPPLAAIEEMMAEIQELQERYGGFPSSG